jgi:uncharacterized membrane-anchored protein
MIRAARLAAAVLPLLGLGTLWAMSDRTYNSGTDWEVPVAGYDPRDFLRGHYVVFGYDWPLDEQLNDVGRQSICLEGEAPKIIRARVLADGEACDHPLRENADMRLSDGRLYIGQARAAQIEQELRNRDKRGIVTIRQREDGSFTPISIRFRPLTPAEIAERDAQNQGAEDLRPPPPVMSQ